MLNNNASGRYTDTHWAVKGKHNEMKLQKEQCTVCSESSCALRLGRVQLICDDTRRRTGGKFGKSLCTSSTVESSWNVMAHGDAREGKFGKSLCTSSTVESSWNVMAHGDAWEGKFGKSLCTSSTVESSWNVMAHGEAREGNFGKSLCTSSTVESSWNVMAHGDAGRGSLESLCALRVR